MHNRKIGRDDLLKIEVRAKASGDYRPRVLTDEFSGLGPRLRLHGVSTLVATPEVLIESDLLVVVDRSVHPVVEIIHPVKTAVVTVTTTGAIATDLEAQTIVIGK